MYLDSGDSGALRTLAQGPGKLPKIGVREFGYLRPKNHQICVRKFGYLRALLAGLCPKFWVFEGRFLPSPDKLGRLYSLHPNHM